jgi:hypothetical protein
MSDSLYFLCLFVTVACAIACLWACRRFTGASAGDGVGGWAVGIGMSSVIGFLASLPFHRTLEMPWWPYIAGGYFAICIVASLLIASKRGQGPAS